MHTDDDIDIDALIQEDAERQEAAFNRQPSPPLNGETSSYRSNTRRAPDPDDMDEDDDALWAAFDDPSIFDPSGSSAPKASTASATPANSGGMPDDDEDDDKHNTDDVETGMAEPVLDLGSLVGRVARALADGVVLPPVEERPDEVDTDSDDEDRVHSHCVCVEARGAVLAGERAGEAVRGA